MKTIGPKQALADCKYQTLDKSVLLSVCNMKVSLEHNQRLVYILFMSAFKAELSGSFPSDYKKLQI